MFVRFLLCATLVALSGPVLACSCWGTASIETTIATQPLLVEGRVVSLEEAGATLHVTRVLKGSVPSNTIKIQDSGCYQSLSTSMMELGATYILPLPQEADGLYEFQASNGRHVMAGCAESALKLLDGKLYTFEQTEGVERRPRLFAEYSSFVRWNPLSEGLAVFGEFLAAAVSIVLGWIGPAGVFLLWILCIGIAVSFGRSPAAQRRQRMVTLITFPLFWLLIGIWGAIFRLDLFPDAEVFRPWDWRVYPPLIGLILFVAMAVTRVARAAGSWAFTVAYGVLNGYLVVMMCLLAEGFVRIM